MERRCLLLSISYLLTIQFLVAQGPCGSGPCEVCGVSATISTINGGEINAGTVAIPGQVQAGQTQSGATPFEITATSCGEISFTIALDFDWDHGNNNNWLHGISFNSSPNWSAADGVLPGPGWLFFPSISGVCSNISYGAGYYYDPPGTSIFDSGNNSSFDGISCAGVGGSEGLSNWLIDGDPADNYGDDCQDNCPTFGFNLTYCPINGGQTMETISFYLTEDGESGGWANSDQCVFLLAFDIIINSAGVQLPTSVGPVCPGECVTLDAGLGCDNYAWSTGESTTQISVCPTESTNYAVTVTGASGCEIEGTVEVVVEACCGASAGIITIDPPQACPGEFINFMVANYNTSANYIQQLLVCNPAGEILQITNGEMGSLSSNFCERYSIYSYNYEAGSQAIIPAVGDHISLLDCNSVCCDLIMEFAEFAEIPAVFINLPQAETVNCADPFPTPGPLFYTNGNTGGCAISGSVNPTISSSGNITIYDWSYTSPCSGLTITHSQSITQTFDLQIEFSPQQANICPEESFDLAKIELINLSGAALTTSFHSATPANAANEITNLEVSPELTTNYYLLTMDDYGCSLEVPFELIVEEEPAAEIIAEPGDVLDCQIQLINLSASPAANAIYSWQINSTVIVATEVQIDAAGNYTLLVTDTLTGCRTADEITIATIEAYPFIQIEPINPITCYTPSTTIDATASQAGPQIFYQWYDAAFNPIPNGQSATLEVDLEGVYYLSVMDQENDCENIDTVFVQSILNVPLAETPDELELPCNETSALLELTSTVNPAWMNIQWSTISGNIINGATSAAVEVEGLGWYYVDIQSVESGCKITDSLLLINNPDVPQAALLAVENESCQFLENGQLDIEQVQGGVPPYQYTLNGESTTEETIFASLEPGNYLLNIMDSNGCEIDTSFEVEAGIDIQLELPALLEILSTDMAMASGVVNVPEQELIDIQWSPADLVSCANCLDTELLGASNQEYVLSVIHENGCTAEANLRLFIKPDINVYIPNVFSPNGDGTNEQFTLFANEEIDKINHLFIFDRWGEAIFKQSDFQPNLITEGWDGTFNGKDMDAGVYVYLFNVQLMNGTELQYAGEVTLLK